MGNYCNASIPVFQFNQRFNPARFVLYVAAEHILLPQIKYTQNLVPKAMSFLSRQSLSTSISEGTINLFLDPPLCHYKQKTLHKIIDIPLGMVHSRGLPRHLYLFE